VRERRALRQGYVLGHSGWSGSSWKAWTSTRTSRPSWCRCGPGRSYGEARKATKRRCGRCGKRCAGYDQGADRRRWRTLDLGLIRAFLEADAPRVRCPEHGVIAAQVPWARHGAGRTYAFDDTAGWLVTHCSKSAVRDLLRVAWSTVGSIVTRVVADDATTVRLRTCAGSASMRSAVGPLSAYRQHG
jgi:hypothetical protein